MGLNRYFVPDLPLSGSFELQPEEARHALQVRREVVGSKCIAFDGRGNVATSRIVRVEKRQVWLEIESYQFAPNELPGWIRLAVAMPKGDRQRAIIERAVELGVHELIPILCDRSVSLPTDSAAEKWHRTVVESCKQCERNRLMTINPPCSFDSMIRSEQSSDTTVDRASLRMFAHPAGRTFEVNTKPRSLYHRIDAHCANVTIAIGPEGGFTNTESQSANAAGWSQLDLGPRILRVETAVCAAIIYASLCVEK